MARTTNSRHAGATMRILVLGLLMRYGPNHGHAMRQFIRNTHVDEWADVQPGSLYYALEQLAKEGLIVEERTEQVGQRPPRTIYRITERGHDEMQRLLVSLLESVRLVNDPVNLALLFSSVLPDAELAELIRHRIVRLKEQLAATRIGREQAIAGGRLGQRGAEIFRHFETQLDADVAWHEQFLAKLEAGEARTLPEEQLTAGHSFFTSDGPLLPTQRH